MEPITNWSALWRELVEIRADGRKHDDKPQDDWEGRVQAFADRVKRRWQKPDSSRDFICAQLDPIATVLDIGAGIGAWTALMAGHAAHVTAVEPSAAMRAYMDRNLAAQNVTNVSVVPGAWPDVTVEPHDFSLCSHAMYGCADFPGFVRQMIASTKKMCFLLFRAPTLDGVTAEASRRVWGHPFDSPNFTVGYNCLLQMGIYPHVLMEDTGLWQAETSPSLDAAFDDLKHYFRLAETDAHDAFLKDLLRRRLTFQDGVYVWPRDVYSALVYWSVDDSALAFREAVT
ncbi:MAG: class I SAM-dependent methyltransferase [Anaerolineae bacterium]|nr:class I SAM-dependent methyltransferase [Anaerolineae bacterium]